MQLFDFSYVFGLNVILVLLLYDTAVRLCSAFNNQTMHTGPPRQSYPEASQCVLEAL